MKKSWISRIMAIFMVGTMMLGLLAGCGSPDSAKTTDAETKATEGKTDSGETEGTTAAPEELTYPLANGGTLKIYADSIVEPISSAFASVDESPFHVNLAKNVGVTIEWRFPVQGSDDSTSLNLLWQEKAEDMPDIILTGRFSNNKAVQWAEDGAIYDLTDYLPQYAPDYWEYLQSDEDVRKSVMTADGRVYAIRGIRESSYNVTYLGPVIRQDWLDECGLDVPVTLEDWENVLVKFKEKYGAVFAFNPGRFNGGVGIASGTGAQASLNTRYYVDDNNKVQLGNAQPEWKEMLEVLHRWYEMDLLDKDFADCPDETMRAKALAGQVGLSITAMSQLTNWEVDAKAQNTGAKWVGIEYPRTAAGEPTVAIQTDKSLCPAGAGAMISSTCTEEELIRALQFLNYGFTEEGIMYHNFGTLGETYTIDANGEVQWTKLITEDPLGLNEAVKKYTAVHSGQIAVQTARYVQMKNSETAGKAVYEWIENTVAQKYQLPTLTMTADESSRYSDLSGPINTYISEMAMKFVTGEEDLANFDNFLKTLNEMGLEECLKLQQAAYDRYMAQ